MKFENNNKNGGTTLSGGYHSFRMYRHILTGIFLWMRPANERRCSIVPSSLIGWAHTQNDPFSHTTAISIGWINLVTPSCSGYSYHRVHRIMFMTPSWPYLICRNQWYWARGVIEVLSFGVAVGCDAAVDTGMKLAAKTPYPLSVQPRGIPFVFFYSHIYEPFYWRKYVSFSGNMHLVNY